MSQKPKRLIIKPAGMTRQQRAQFTLFKTVIARQADAVNRLKESLASQKNLIQNIAHELKNPMTVLYGYASLLMAGSSAMPPAAANQLRALERNLALLSSLIEELLEGARLDAGKIALDRADFSCSALAEEAAADVRFEAMKKEIDLRVEAGPADMTVYADERRTRQILLNLLGNAIKFTPRGGSVLLSVERGEGCARFRVQDTGVGIPERALPRLFERFYQAEDGRGAGLGLGLSISKGLVELHGGKIWAESGSGAGASFFFTLPLSARRARRHSGLARAGSETSASPRPGTRARPG